MRLVAEQNPTVIRGGETRQISQEEIVEGDLLVYSLGDQIIVDSEIKAGTIEVNEAFITGEQESIHKTVGDKLISGSFVVAGTCKAEAVAVGKESECSYYQHFEVRTLYAHEQHRQIYLHCSNTNWNTSFNQPHESSRQRYDYRNH